jgi:hypothetical protein
VPGSQYGILTQVQSGRRSSLPIHGTSCPGSSQPFPVQYFVGVDGMSLSLVVLTAFVTLMSVLSQSTSIGDNRPRLYYAMLMLLTFSVQGVFMSLDLLQFFVLYELELSANVFPHCHLGRSKTRLCSSQVFDIYILWWRIDARRTCIYVHTDGCRSWRCRDLRHDTALTNALSSCLKTCNYCLPGLLPGLHHQTAFVPCTHLVA